MKTGYFIAGAQATSGRETQKLYIQGTNIRKILDAVMAWTPDLYKKAVRAKFAPLLEDDMELPLYYASPGCYSASQEDFITFGVYKTEVIE